MSQPSPSPDSIAVAAHRAFLASQSKVHPVLQEIQNMNTQYGTASPAVGSGGTNQIVVPASELGEELGRMDQDGVEETISTEVFSSYRHREILPGCKPHPGDIVEAGPLAALTPPEAHYPLADSLPAEIISEGKLSSLQLEGVIQACQRHQIILPNGQRAGFFIGDAAGVGKGRQIAGVILDNFARGRTKCIWFTISADLIVDTRRDLADLGCYIKVIDGCQELDKHTRVLGLPADFKEGVVFSTYATLVSSVQRGGAFSSSRQSRLKQLVDWCGGENFDGCLIFDECHKAKNFVPGKEQASTKIAIAVTSIQRMLPMARVLYCSATGVTDVKNMAFMERLGLWGEGAPYRNFEQFLVSIQKKGLGMAEMLAMEMKSAGMYVSRGLSYKQAEFLTIEAILTKEQRKVYDTAVHVWNELRKALESAVNRTVSSSNRVWANFWSCHQRFFKQLCLGMKVPTIVKEAREAVENGFCIVIGLQTTGEASLDSELGKSSGSIRGFMSLCREMLYRFIEQNFPTQVPSTIEGEIKEDPWSVTAKKMLLEFAKKIALPNSPLDEIIDQLGGPSNVAEMTGRKGRIVRHTPKDTPTYETRTPDTELYGAIDSLNVQERNMFMEGKKFVAIISDAASTGISLHADHRVANQRRRIHLTVELPWSADKAVQQLGRSHRSNQSSGPLYKLLTTDLGGERRFAAAVARRLQSLGALTKGDRRAATGADLTEFNFDTQYGRNAPRTMYTHICRKQFVSGLSLKAITDSKYDFETFNKHMQESLVLMGLVDIGMLQTGPVLKEKDTGDVSKFLNRILGLTVEKQNMIFTYFTECLKLTIQNAKKEGRYNEGLLDITASSVELIGKPVKIFKDCTKGQTSTKLVELNIDRGMSWEQAVVRADLHQQKQDGFYISKRDVWGKRMYILATQKENSTHLFKIARPNTGLSVFDEERNDLFTRYQPIGRDEAEKGWKIQYEKTKDSCVHGTHCKNKEYCKVGSRCYRLHLLCGSIVSMMNILENTLNRYASSLNLTKSESTIRVVRVQLNDGERVVGVRYPKLLISEVEKVLKEQKLMESYQQQSQQSNFLTQGHLPSLQPSSSQMISSQLFSSQVQAIASTSSIKSDLDLLCKSPSTSSQNTHTSKPDADTKSVVDKTFTKQYSYGNKSVIKQNTDCDEIVLEHDTDGVKTVLKQESSVVMRVDNCADQGVDVTGTGVNDVNSVVKHGPSSPVKTTREAVTPVSAKCLSKAMKPPVTIKNFFKKAERITAVTSDKNQETLNEKELCTTAESTNADKKVSEMSYEEFLNREDGSEYKMKPAEVSAESMEAALNLKNDKKRTSDVNSRAAIKINDSKSTFAGSRKRANENESSQPTKKAKQATLFSTLKKMSNKKEEYEKKAASCPICQKEFEKGISNAELNRHVDNCIIE